MGVAKFMAMFWAASRLLNIGRVCRDEASGDLDLAIGEDQCPAKV